MLTNAQNKVWQFIQDYILKHTVAPTIAEITLGLGLKSRSAVHRAVQAIADEGYIRLIPNKRRNIAIVEEGDADHQEYGIPLVGCIAAGEPIEAVEQNESINLNDLFVGPKRYLLKVKGSSMIGDNICDGDYVVCEQTNVFTNGKIVVALVDNEEATLKRIRRNDDGSVTLIPSNPELQPMVYEAGRVKIQGVFIGLFRVVLGG